LRSFDEHLCIEEGTSGLEGELERAEFEGQLVALGALEQASLELGGVLEDVAVEGVEQEHLVGGDDAPDLLEVDDDGALAPQDRGGVDEERVEQAEVPRGELAAPHHGGLVDLQRLHGGRGGLDADPAARAAAALLQVGDVEPPREAAARGPGGHGREGRRGRRRDVGRVRAVEERLLGGVPGGGHGARRRGQPVIGRGGPRGAVGSFCRWAPALVCRVAWSFQSTRGDEREPCAAVW